MDGAGAFRRWWPWLVVLVLVAIGSLPLHPPAPQDASAPLRDFSADRAERLIAAIAVEPHPMGSDEIVAVRRTIEAELETLGLTPVEQPVRAPDIYGTPGATVDVVNVMARIPGSDSTGAVVLMGHYDTMTTTAGANDNSSAVAVLLETARAVLEGPQMRNDLILLFTDGEEPAPRFGSPEFLRSHPWADDVGFVVNFEALGSSGPSVLGEVNGSTSWIVPAYAASDSRPAAFSVLTGIGELLGEMGTDFDPFKRADIPGIHVAYLRGSPIYHTMADDIESVDLRSVQHHGDHAMAVVEAFGAADLARDHGDEDAVFFTLGRSVLVRYPASWALPLGLLAAVGLWFALGAAGRDRWRALTAAAQAGGRLFGAALVASLLAAVAWRLLLSVRPTPGIGEAYGYLALLVGIAVGVVALMRRRRRRALDPRDEAAGALLVWIVLALLTGTLPALSYPFTWVALGGVGALGVARRLPEGAARQAAMLGLAAAPAALFLTPVIDFLFQMAQPRPGNLDSQMVEVIAIAMLFVLLAFELFRSLHGLSTAERDERAGSPFERAGAVPAERIEALT